MEGTEFRNMPSPQPKSPGVFILLGCCVIALGIFFAGNSVANRIPHSLHGNFHGNFTSGAISFSDPGEFMNVWQAAGFVGLQPEEFRQILQTGELTGTYTVFNVQEQQWQHWGTWQSGDVFWDMHTGRSIQVHPPAVSVDAWGGAEVAVPVQQEYEWVDIAVYVFSRERLAEWMIARIDG